MTTREKYRRTDMNLEQKHGVTATTQDVLTHHLNCFGRGDLAGTMADYTAESRFFTPDGLLHGSEAIGRFFVRLFEEFAKPGMSFEMLRQEVDGDTAYIGSPRRIRPAHQLRLRGNLWFLFEPSKRRALS
jgi:SnoaL-like domain